MTGYFSYVDANGIHVRGFTDAPNMEEAAIARMVAEFKFWNDLDVQEYENRLEAKRTDNWNPKRRFRSKVKHKVPTINLGMAVNQLEGVT